MDVAQLVHLRPRAAGAPSWWERRRRRGEADAWIAAGFAPRFDWRVAELTSRRERRTLARSIRSAVSDLSPRRLPGPSPLNRVALRPHASVLVALADRLDDLARPVSAAGIIEVQRLLTEPDSSLYARPAPEEPGRSRAAGSPQRLSDLADAPGGPRRDSVDTARSEIAQELGAVLEHLEVR